ncbi:MULTISPECIES: acyl carrier protein [Streptomyces]|uniref:acyl carrier protein n=1 Tax=Streptomyces TaxID=1883 RepID=UPI000CD54C4D|nr:MULTISPECIES: phosphopantetheine-binding protein [Streptomyces]
MDRAEIVEHLRHSLSVILDRPLPEFSAETRILEDLELDSMRFIELLMSLEDTIGLDVDPESLEPEVFGTAGSLADYIRNRTELAEAG